MLLLFVLLFVLLFMPMAEAAGCTTVLGGGIDIDICIGIEDSCICIGVGIGIDPATPVATAGG